MSSAPLAVSGILIDEEIDQEVGKGNLVTDESGGVIPRDRRRIRSCSYDLTVGTIFWESKILKQRDASVVVPPGGIIAIFTEEEIVLPNDICATAFAINDLSSKGLLVVNPGHVDPGFRGALTVKALNVRKTPIVVHHGDPIFTVVFQRLTSATKGYQPNVSREERERLFNRTVVETAPRTFFDMMAADRNGPYPGREEVRTMIASHWASRVSVAASILILIFAAVSAYTAMFPRSGSAAVNEAHPNHESPTEVMRPQQPPSPSNSAAPVRKEEGRK